MEIERFKFFKPSHVTSSFSSSAPFFFAFLMSFREIPNRCASSCAYTFLCRGVSVEPKQCVTKPFLAIQPLAKPKNSICRMAKVTGPFYFWQQS